MRPIMQYIGAAVIFLFATSCSASKALKQESLQEATNAIEFRQATMENYKVLPGTFSMELVEKIHLSPRKGHSLSYPVILCTPKISGLPPGEYWLYTPFASDPTQPELLMQLACNEQGEMGSVLSEEFADQLRAHEITMKPPLPYISLFANPGFCSDWYLFGGEGMLHTTFIYQPIKTSSQDGKELIITKREPGGNLLEVVLNGFAPHSKVQAFSDAEGCCKEHLLEMDALGSACLLLRPVSRAKKSGTVKFWVPLDSDTLTVSCEWDTSTLSSKGEQPLRQGLMKLMKNFSPS